MRSSDLLKVTQLVSGRTRIWTRSTLQCPHWCAGAGGERGWAEMCCYLWTHACPSVPWLPASLRRPWGRAVLGSLSPLADLGRQESFGASDSELEGPPEAIVWLSHGPQPCILLLSLLPDSSELYQTFKEQSVGILHKYFLMIEKNNFMKLIIWNVNDLHNKRRKNTWKRKNYRPISAINIDAKTLNIVLANGVRQSIKSIVQHAKLDLS